MNEQQLSALIGRVKEDADLRESLMSAVDIAAAVEILKEAGFDVSERDWMKYQANQMVQTRLSDEELEGIAGGKSGMNDPNCAGISNVCIGK